MAPAKSSRSSDGKRVSSEKHEISYTAGQLPQRKRGSATAAVRKAKSTLGRKTKRSTVVKKAKQLA